MNTPPSLQKPSLIVVTGRPGSGKTTLAHALARAVRCPLISRDEVKEGYVNTTNNQGRPGDDIARNFFETFFDTLELLLRRDITTMAEAAFQHKLWAPRLEALSEIAQIRIVLCTVPPELARSRHIERGLSDSARLRFHSDGAVHAAKQGKVLPIGNYDPPHLDFPLLTVDTSEGYRPEFEAILSWLRGET